MVCLGSYIIKSKWYHNKSIIFLTNYYLLYYILKQISNYRQSNDFTYICIKKYIKKKLETFIIAVKNKAEHRNTLLWHKTQAYVYIILDTSVGGCWLSSNFKITVIIMIGINSIAGAGVAYWQNTWGLITGSWIRLPD